MTDANDNFGNSRYGWFGGGYGGGYGPNYGGYGQGTFAPPGYGPSGAFVGAQPNTWVLGPYTGYGPQGRIPSDQRIEDDVIDGLTQHGHLDARGIQVKVHDREVTLTGSVDSRQAKRLAEDIADSVNGVQDVHNELKIQGQQGQPGQTGQGQQGQQAGQGKQSQPSQQTRAQTGAGVH